MKSRSKGCIMQAGSLLTNYWLLVTFTLVSAAIDEGVLRNTLDVYLKNFTDLMHDLKVIDSGGFIIGPVCFYKAIKVQ